MNYFMWHQTSTYENEHRHTKSLHYYIFDQWIWLWQCSSTNSVAWYICERQQQSRRKEVVYELTMNDIQRWICVGIVLNANNVCKPAKASKIKTLVVLWFHINIHGRNKYTFSVGKCCVANITRRTVAHVYWVMQWAAMMKIAITTKSKHTTRRCIK